MTTRTDTDRARVSGFVSRGAPALTLLCVLVSAPAHALCGDLTGDGYVRASDALATLVASVGARYDPRADVVPQPPDAKLTASDALAVLRAAAFGVVPACAAAERTVVATLASCDFVSGGLAAVDTSSRAIVRQRTGVTAADAVVRRQLERTFVLNRFGANTIMEVSSPDTLEPLWECSVGTGANPHDLVLVSATKGYVTRYDSTKLAVIDPSAGPAGCAGFLTGAVDLGPWADADGFPEMDQMALVGEALFVVLQRLNRNSFFRPAGPGMVVVIDTQTDAVTDVIELAITNPFAETKGIPLHGPSGELWLAGPGTFFSDLADGGIERVDTAARRSLGVVATGADLGGDITDFVLVGDRRAYAIVAGAGFRAALIELDLASGRPSAVLAESAEQLSDVELMESGELWLADRRCAEPGFRVFSIASNAELTPAPVAATLAPFTLTGLR